MRLRRKIAVAIIAIAVGTGAAATASDNHHPFTVTISAPHKAIYAGGEIRIHVVLTNISDHTIVINRSASPEQADVHYTLHVRDKLGKDAPETQAFIRSGRKASAAGSEISVDLDPGQKLEEDCYLNGQFDFSVPGEYEVQLSRQVSTDPGDGVVKSNTITISVAAADSSTIEPK